MKVAIFGGTGFVGSYLTDALVDAGMQPVLLVRTGHEQRVQHPDQCLTVTGSIDDGDAVNQVLSGADAVIYCIGILREFPNRGITFDELQHHAVGRVIAAAEHAGVRRFLLMSANGVDLQQTTYQRTKYAAEKLLLTSPLDGTVFRPSVIFGDPRGRMEFASQLLSDVILPPLPAPLFYGGLLPTGAGKFRLSPTHVADVADAFVAALTMPATVGQVLPLGGPEALTWREILERIAAAVGRRKFMLPVTALGVSIAARLFERFDDFPVTRDQITMLLQGNTCTVDAYASLGITPTAFDQEGLAYLEHNLGERSAWHQNAA